MKAGLVSVVVVVVSVPTQLLVFSTRNNGDDDSRCDISPFVAYLADCVTRELGDDFFTRSY